MSTIQNIKVAVDAVVFGYTKKGQLDVLLIKRKIEPFKDSWALPGGLVQENESLDHAVKRELKEETGVEVDFLEQLYTFGTPNRDPRNRVVSVVYFGMVSPKHYKLEASTDAEEADWFDILKLPELAFDHLEIFEIALKRLRAKIQYQPIGFNLLGKKFPFSAIEDLYTTVLGQNIDRRNFRKKLLSFGILEETN
ncbi:MAG: NUDIX domain-containing protein, partial [Bacteroidota bacterium]